MSMWIVTEQDITVLVHGLTRRELISVYSPTQVGQILWAENLRSCWYRYADTQDSDENYPAAADFRGEETVLAYRYRPPTEIVGIHTLLGVAECYGYQACEHPGWDDSEAHAWVSLLTETLAREGASDSDPSYAWGMEAYGRYLRDERIG